MNHNHHKKSILLGFILLASVAFIPILIHAESAPHAFEGCAKDTAGQYIKNGTRIMAMVIDNFPGGDGDVEYYNTTVNNSLGTILGGHKNFQLTVLDPEGDNRLGSTIYFFIGNENTSNHTTFHEGWVNINYAPYYNLSVTALTLSNISAGSITATSATITWTTNKVANSTVEYGTTTSYGSTSKDDATFSTSHSIPLSGLSSGTTYHYRVRSYDRAGNNNSSSDHSFTTLTGGSNPPPQLPPSSNPPIADAGGPYSGYVNQSLRLNGSNSTGAVSYRWDFTSDGVYDTSWLTTSIIDHNYTKAGKYIVTLEVKDNSGVTDDDTANVTIIVYHKQINATNTTMNETQAQFGITLSEQFYAYDSNGDGIVDTFIDPNGVLTMVRFANISGNASFLLSTNGDMIPEFFWDTESNTIIPLTYSLVTISENDIWVDVDDKQVTVVANVNKTGWMYIRVVDQYPLTLYPEFTLTITTSAGRIISPHLIWRENGFVYVLDDPATQYLFLYGYDILSPKIEPADGTTFTNVRPTITITYYETVTILSATLNDADITSQLTTTDNKIYLFTPAADLSKGTYTLTLTAQNEDGNTTTATATYTINPVKQKEEGIPLWIFIVIALILIIIIILFILRKLLLI